MVVVMVCFCEIFLLGRTVPAFRERRVRVTANICFLETMTKSGLRQSLRRKGLNKSEISIKRIARVVLMYVAY